MCTTNESREKIVFRSHSIKPVSGQRHVWTQFFSRRESISRKMGVDDWQDADDVSWYVFCHISREKRPEVAVAFFENLGELSPPKQ
jgi:hypothetical protein